MNPQTRILLNALTKSKNSVTASNALRILETNDIKLAEGGFMTAVVNNDLELAYQRADLDNTLILRPFVIFAGNNP